MEKRTGQIDISDLPPDFSSNKEGYEYFQYSYRDPYTNSTHSGKLFYASKDILEKHHMPLKYLPKLTQENVLDFVFVMACSANHFKESKDCIATIQEQFPTHQVYYYDWGLKPAQVEELKTLCNVHYRPFNLNEYPASKHQFGRPLYQSAKIFCIMDTLIDHNGVFWLDASIRFLNRTIMNRIFSMVVKNGGFMFTSTTEHSSYAVTHPDMYKYLPTDLEVQKKLYQGVTYAVLMYKTKKVYDNILWWWFLCSLHAECMTPILNLLCHFKEDDNMLTYANCHRFDQSASNILGNNLYHYNDSLYNYPFKLRGGFDVARDQYGQFTPMYCMA